MGRLHLTEARIVGVVADGRSDSCRGEWVEPILVMVEDVKCLRPELERDSFCEVEVPISQLLIPGPRKRSRPVFPNWPERG